MVSIVSPKSSSMSTLRLLFLPLLVSLFTVLLLMFLSIPVASVPIEEEYLAAACNCTLLEVCDQGRCLPATCFNLEWTPESNETDVDCGGELCSRRCSVSRRCASNQDCASNVCSPRRHVCLPRECGDSIFSGNETGIDCGGPQCDPCGPGMDCERNEDCVSKKCETNDRFICLDSNCEGQPCGESPFCPRCAVGASCQHDAQCESGHCESGICYHADCERCGVRPLCPPCSAGEPCENDSQCASKRCSEITHTCLAEYCEDGSGRCGGLCEPCGAGGTCDSDADCSSGLQCDLDASKCAPKHCFDGVLQIDVESDIDCGGECMTKCSFLESCHGDSDCSRNGICDPDARKCIAPSCVNQIRDPDETDVDCGNSLKSGCLPCQRSGSGCLVPSDADSSIGMVCDVNLQSVVPSHCLDGKLTGDETSVDCGGSSCSRRCPPGASCLVDSDCMSNDCFEGLCVPLTCHNGKRDFNETDVDCGGGFCRPCSLSGQCRLDSDCLSGMCSEFSSKCQPPECATHCGGPCDPCPDSTPCSSDGDCLSGFCYGETSDPAALAKAFNLLQDARTGNFVFLDAARGVCLPSRCQSKCGKGDCPGCATGEKCSSDAECASGSCDPIKLICHASSCFNSVKDDEETDVDCGGPMCPPCTLSSQSCVVNSDCASNECSNTKHKCIPLSCFNLLKDNKETDVDCGGSECNACEFMGAGCKVDEDCAESFSCSPNDKVCIPSTCFNGLRDSNEVDVDCGLAACGVPCKDGSVCNVATDCASGICHLGNCLPVHCASECGQVGCPNKCVPGDVCERDSQCDSDSVCLNSRCVNERSCQMDWKASGASDPSGCGGSKCGKCGPHRLCQQTPDCDFGLVCDRASRRCEFETCFDGLLSPGEVCVDGGGVCRRRCSLGQSCKSSFDCERGAFCTEHGICSDRAELEELRLKAQREELLSSVKIVSALPPLPEMDEMDDSFPNPPPPQDEFEEPFKSQSIRASLIALVGLKLPEVSISSKSDVDWTAALLAVATRVRSRIDAEDDRILVVENSARQALFQRAVLEVDSLCDPATCVMEGLFSGSQMIHPHVFYVVSKNAADIVVPVSKVVSGLFISPGARVTFSKGAESHSLSVVAAGSVLMLGPGDSRFRGGLVIERGAELHLLAGATLAGSRLVAFGNVVLHGDAVIEMEDPIQVFGKMSVMEPGVHLKTSAIVHGLILLKGGSSLQLDKSTDIHGSLVVEGGEHGILDSASAVNFMDGALLLVPPSSRLSLVAQSRVLLGLSSPSVPSRSVAWIAGTIEILERSALTARNGSHVAVLGEADIQSGSRLDIIGTSSVVVLNRLLLGDQTVLSLQSPTLLLSPLPSRSASSTIRLESDLVIVDAQMSTKRTLQGRMDFFQNGRILMANNMIGSAAVDLNTTTTATTNRVEFLGPVVVSSISEFIVGLPDRPFLELAFMAQVIFTHPIVFYSNTTVEFHSQAFIANSVQNHGQFVLTAQAYLVISHTYTGAGSVSNAGSIVVLGDVLCSSRSFTGQGSIVVGSVPSSVMDTFSQRIFAFLEPTGVYPCATGSVAQRLSLSLVSTTQLLIHFCVPSGQRTREGLLDVIRPSLDVGEPDPTLTRPNGVPLAPGESLPDTVRLLPTDSQLKSILASPVGVQRKLVSSMTEGGTLEFTQAAKVAVQGQVTVSSTGYLAMSRKADCSFTGGFEAQGDVWIGPDTSTTFSWVVESTSNFTIEKTANVTFTRASATFSGHLSQSGSVSSLLYTNLTIDGFFENHGDIFSAASCSLSFLAPHGSRNQHSFGLSPVFYFTEGSILDSRGYLYYGPRTKSIFEKGSLIESSGVFVLEETGWILVETSYLFLEGTTEILGQLILRGKQSKAKFLGTSSRVAGLVSAESDGLVEFLSKAVYLQAPGTVQTKTRGKVIYGAPQGVFSSVGGSMNGSVDFVGLDSVVTWRQNSSFSCYDTCQVKRVNMTLERECRMDVFGKMEMNANFRAEEGSSVTIHGPNGTLHILGGDFEILGNFTSTDGGELILESPRILGRRDLVTDRTVVKTQLFSTSSCSGESLVIHSGASLRLETGDASKKSNNKKDDDLLGSTSTTDKTAITCLGTSPLILEPGATLVIASHVRMARKLITWKDSKLIVEEGAKLELANEFTNVLSGDVALEKHAQFIGQAAEIELEGKTTLAMNSLFSVDTGEVKLQDGSEMMCTKPGCSVVIHHRAFMSIAAAGSSLAVTGENAFLDIQGKLKNNGRLLVAGHGTKAMVSGHYIGLGDFSVDNFAKVFVKGSLVSSFPGKFENSGGFVIFVRGSESLFRTRSFVLGGMAKVVIEESSKVSIHSERLDFAHKTKFIVSGGNVTVAQSYVQLQNGIHDVDEHKVVGDGNLNSIPTLANSQQHGVIEVGGSWITSHSSSLDVVGSVRLRRGARMELEGKLKFSTRSFSDFIRLESSSSLKVVSGSLHVLPDVFMESGSELIVLGSVKVFSRFVNNGGLVSVEGKLRFHSSEASFKSGTLDVLQAGAVHFESEKCVAGLDDVDRGGHQGYYFSHESAIHSQGLLQVHPCALITCSSKLVSTGDIVLEVNSKMVLSSSATFDSSLPSTVHLEGELVVEKGSSLRWSSPGTGTATALIQVFGSLQFASQDPVELSFVTETSDVSLREDGSTTMKGARLVVKESGILSGSAQLRNCSLIVQGRLEPGDLERAGVFIVDHGDFEVLPGGFLETDVRLRRADTADPSKAAAELAHDAVDVKHGNVRIHPQSTVAFAVLDVDKFDLSVITCDAHRLFWTREGLRVAAYSVDFEQAFEELSYHVYETENAQGTALRVRVETLLKSGSSKDGDNGTMSSKSSAIHVSQRAEPTLTLGSTGINRVRLSGPAKTSDVVKNEVEKYLGGVVEAMDASGLVLAVHCFEPFECRAFCQVLDLVRDDLAKALGVDFVAEHPPGACDQSRFWPRVLLPCVTDGLSGSASRGEPCDFPFEHQGVTYSSNCATDEVLGDWCLTAKGHWGGCVCGPYAVEDEHALRKRESKTCKTNGMGAVAEGVSCVFPFFEDRSSFEPHFGCVGSGMGGFGFCRVATGEMGGCSSSCSPRPTLSSSTSSSQPAQCVTNGRGSAPGGKRCVFPFEWMGRKRFGCVGSGWGGGEGFCLTATGRRGGCACSSVRGGDDDGGVQLEEDANAIYFVRGPSVRVLSEDSVEVTAELNSVAAGTRQQWYVFVVEHDARPPTMPSSSLKDAVGVGSREQPAVLVKGLDWRVQYDFYLYAPGFDQEDFIANAITGVKLKPPRSGATRFDLAITGRDSFLLGGSLNVELVEGGEKVELVITRKSLGGNDQDGDLVDVFLEPSVPDQIWLSERSFSLKKEMSIEIRALKDDIQETSGSQGASTVVLHVIDVERAASATLEISILDAETSKTSGNQQDPQSLVLISLPDDQEEGEEVADSKSTTATTARRKLMTMSGKSKSREYMVRLASPPAHPVVIHIESVLGGNDKKDPTTIEPSVLVFTKNDWDKRKRVKVSSLRDVGSTLLRHRVRSKDSRFADAVTTEMQIRILGDQHKKEKDDDELVDGDDDVTTPQTTSSSVVSILPAEANLFPKTSIQFQLYSSSSIDFRLVPKISVVVQPSSQRTTKGRDLNNQQLFYHPSTIQLNRTSPSATLTVWMERDPGQSFTSRLTFEVMRTAGMDSETLKQLQGLVSSMGATIRYISRSPAIVLSKPALSSVKNEEYSISLSVPHTKVVTVRISTASDSVCLDLDANMQRPCDARTCRRCMEDVPEILLSPRIVKFTPSTTVVTVKVAGWADHRLLEPPRDGNAPLIIRHRVVMVGEGADDPLFSEATPTVFGPGDSAVDGVVISNPGSPPRGDDDDDGDGGGGGGDDRRKRKVSIEPVANSPGAFKITLRFVSRAPVTVNALGAACRPDSLRLDHWTEEVITRCYASSSPSADNNNNAPAKHVRFVVTSEDPEFDQIDATVALPPGTPQSPDAQQSKAESEGVIIRIVVGITSSLTTLVALLVVWVFMGPRASNTWLGRRRHRADVKDGKGPGERAGKRPPPSMGGGGDDQGNHTIATPAEQPQTAKTTMPTGGSVLRHVSAAVSLEDAHVLFSLPPPEQFHVSDVVVVRYDVFEDVQYFKGRIVEENAMNETYVVQFVDGDVDQEVDPDAMRKYLQDMLTRPRSSFASSSAVPTPSSSSHGRTSTASSVSTRSSGPLPFYDVRLVRTSEAESFGLKIGWTTNDRVVVTGFVPGTVAFATLELQLGDEIIGMNGRKTPGTFEAVMALMRSSGTELDLRLRPARLTSAMGPGGGGGWGMNRLAEESQVLMDEDDGHSGSGTGDVDFMGGEGMSPSFAAGTMMRGDGEEEETGSGVMIEGEDDELSEDSSWDGHQRQQLALS